MHARIVIVTYQNNWPSPAPSKKKSTSKKKQDDVPYITFEQKQEISEKINSLPPNKMANALKMIQEGMPSLKGVRKIMHPTKNFFFSFSPPIYLVTKCCIL